LIRAGYFIQTLLLCSMLFSKVNKNALFFK
jgi:hypothetical protein